MATKKELEEIQSKLDQMMTLQQIADERGVTRQAVSAMVKRHNLRLPDKKSMYAQRATQRNQRITQLIEEGWSQTAIGRELDLTGARIGQIVEDLGLRDKAAKLKAARDNSYTLSEGRLVERKWSNDQIIELLRKSAALRPNSPLKRKDYVSDPWEKPSPALIDMRFGSWSAACTASRVKSTPRIAPLKTPRIPDTEIERALEEFVQLHEDTNLRPTWSRFRTWCEQRQRFSADLVRQRLAKNGQTFTGWLAQRAQNQS